MTALSLCKSHDDEAVREMMTRIGDKWSIFLVVALAKANDQRARFTHLQKAIPGISQRMLSATLRNLEKDGMVTRTVFAEVPPRVEYQLTTLGMSLLDPMQALVDWVGKHWDQVQNARSNFEKNKTSG